MSAPTSRTYRPRSAFRIRGYVGAAVLLVFSLVLVVSAALSGSVVGVVVLALIALAAATMLYAMRHKRAVLSTDELVVHGSFTTTRVPLADITAICHQDRRGLVTWVAATDLRPFRIHFVTGYDGFVRDVRTRAAAAGARLDVDAELVAPAPSGTRPFFTL